MRKNKTSKGHHLIQKYFTSKMLRLKKSVRKQYNYTCQICGTQDLHIPIHHKIPLRDIRILYELTDSREKVRNCKLLWDRNWLIPLCKECENEVDNPKLAKNYYKECNLTKYIERERIKR